MRENRRRSQIGVLLLAICTSLALIPLGRALARDYELPAGTILKLSMDNYLTSKDARVGDPFTATVFEDVRVSGDVVVPRGSKVKGRVSSVQPASRGSKSGTISIDFEQILLTNGPTIDVEGQLTSLDVQEKRQIDEEGKVSGGSVAKRNVIFIGGGAAGGAVIGAVAGGGKGAGIGAVAGGIAGALGSVFSKGEEAQVQAGTKFGMEIVRPVLVPENYVAANNGYRGDSRDRRYDDRRDDRGRDDRGRGDDRRDDRYDDRRDDRRDDRGDGRSGGYRPRPSVDFASQPMIRRAQVALRDLGYYKAPISGIAGTAMKASLRTFQRDYDLEQTGNLDFDTAYALGLINEDGLSIMPVKILNANAERLTDGTIRVKANAEANTGGWNVFADSVVDGDILRVNVKGTPPEGVATQAITRYPVDVSVRDNRNTIKTVIVRGEGTPITLELGSANLELVRQIHQQASGLFDTYKTAIGVGRPGSGSGDLTNVNRLTEAQAQVLTALNNLNNSALFAEQLILVRAPDQAVRGTITQLMREARQTNRLLERTNEFNRVERQWVDFDRNLRKMVDAYRLTYDNNDRD